MKHIDKIDNSFLRTTDIIYRGDSIPTRRIWIDKDPTNVLFFDFLQYDIIKAIAWQEYAGSNDTTHCHEYRSGGYYYNRQYNNYWDYFVDSHRDTCFDTRTPCENAKSTATGIMQIVRTQFENLFAGHLVDTLGYYRSSWDSLAWNWKINIHNGKYIFFPYNFHHMTEDQKTWDSTCVLCDPADMVPKSPNREDLSSYGFNQGIGAMRVNLNKDNWLKKMTEDTPGAIYVRAVRLHKYVKPWQL